MQVSITTTNENAYNILKDYVNEKELNIHTFEYGNKRGLIIVDPDKKVLSDITRYAKSVSVMTDIICDVNVDIIDDENNNIIDNNFEEE